MQTCPLAMSHAYNRPLFKQEVRYAAGSRSSQPAPPTSGCVATIGNFDGVHRGHQAILARLRERAAELGLLSCVVIFEPQPREYFSPDRAPARLTRLREKLQLLASRG